MAVAAAVLALGSPPAFAATPVIVSITGTVQTGQTLTVAGAHLNDEVKTNWDGFFSEHPLAWSFEGSSPVADGYGQAGPTNGVYDTNISILGVQSMRFDLQAPSGDESNPVSALNALAFSGHTNFHVRGYVRWNPINGGWPSDRLKMLLSGYSLGPAMTADGTPPTQMTAADGQGGGSMLANIPSGALENNRWYAIEVHFSPATGRYEAWMDGVQIFDRADLEIKGGTPYLQFGVVEACCTAAGFQLEHWWDGLAVASSRIYPSALVEVGDRPDHTTATRVTQELLRIEDGELTLKLNLAGLGPGPFYLWVTNNRQERSQPRAIALPMLRAQQSGPDALLLTWSTNDAEATVHSTTSLALPATWTAVAEAPTVVDGEHHLLVGITGQERHFQLQTAAEGVGYLAEFQTLGSVFEPEVSCEGDAPPEFLWIWSDGTVGTAYPVASKDFGAPGTRVQRLLVRPADQLISVNLGFDGADGGETTPLAHRAPQQVGSVHFLASLTGLRYWASSYNPITNTLDFTGFTRLEAIECYRCSNLQQVVVTDLPALQRACLEECDLQALDLSGNPNLGDLRGAVNAYTNIVVGRGTGPNIWHWCTRDNPQLTQPFQEIMTNFYALRELLIWNNNQRGRLTTVSTNLVYVNAAINHYGEVDFTGQHRLRTCVLYDNELTNLVLTGCTALTVLDAHGNRLGAGELDGLLAFLDTAASNVSHVNLSQNAAFPSEVGYGHYTNLVDRGVTVYLDWPETGDGRLNVPGGTNAITFVTLSQHPHMEVQTPYGRPTELIWHWGDGRISRGDQVVHHAFETPGQYTNYVEVTPPDCVRYFGAEWQTTGQGIQAVYGASNFPRLGVLYLFRESVTELSLAGCSNLLQLHLAENPVPVEVCDQWFMDLDAAVTGPVTNANFWYPSRQRSANSDAAWTNLVNKGYSMHAF